MDSFVTTLEDGVSISGRGLMIEKGRGLKAPKNIILNADTARTYYENFRKSHVERIKLYAAIKGLLDGNPPYDSKKLAQAGLSHIANVNTLDAKSIYERAALTFWNLSNQTENFARFELRPFATSSDADYSNWSEVLARNWTKVIKERWEDFIPQMNMLTGQLVMFGYSPLVWPDERDFRWEVIDVSRFYVPDDTSVVVENWDCVCVETMFTMQFLYAVYESLDGADDNPWNREALKEFLLARANNANRGGGVMFNNMLEIQNAIANGSYNYANMFTDSVRLVNLFKKEYSGKISHYIFDPTGQGTREFLFNLSEEYDSFREVLIVFTYSPGEFKIHGNRGVGHKIFPVCQAMMQLDGHMLDMAKMSATPIVKSNPVVGKDITPIRFISGTPTDIGTAEFVPNQLGANINQLVAVAQYMEQKVNRNAAISGDDPGVPDPDRGSKSAPEVQMQSIKEFGVGKQNVAHFYKTMDIVIRQMVLKMLKCKKSHPGYEIVEEWKELCLDEGVPPEIFGADDAKNGNLPRHLTARASRVAGDGSNLGLIMGLNGVAGIAGGFGAKGQHNYRKDIITSRLGMDYAERYLSDSQEPDESAGGASLAQLENIAMKNGEMPQATKDNQHKSHFGSHMALIQDTMQKVQAQKLDPIAADHIFSLAIPHTQEHVQFLSEDELNAGFIKDMEPSWRQIGKFVQFNRVKAQKMMQTEVRRRAEEEQKQSVEMMEQERKDQVAEREQKRKDFESQGKMKRAEEQSHNKAEIMKRGVDAKAENERRAIELKANNESVVRKPEEILADQSTEQLQNTLASQIGNTPNPADFE